MNGMRKYLVEYRMYWAGKVVKEDIVIVEAFSDFFAKLKVIDQLQSMNRKASIEVGEVVEV